MNSWLTPQRLMDYEHRLRYAADDLVIELGTSKETTTLSDEADDLEEVLFDGEVLCEEYSVEADYRHIDVLTMIAIADQAHFELNERLLNGGGVKYE